MKWLVYLFLALVASFFVYDHVSQLTQSYEMAANRLFPPKPCSQPIHYAIGQIDPQFHLSQATFSQDITQASSIWSNAVGKPIFVYDPKAKLMISLVYDGRQSLETQIGQMQGQLQNSQQSLDPAIKAYQQHVADFRVKVTNLNEQINSWNAQGGAPPDVYSQLTHGQQALKAEADQLNAEAKQLNQSTEAYNTDVAVLNQTVSDFNNELSTKPEEGLYDPNNDTIDIFFNISHDELVHTLAHEMGHALGLNHVPDKNAIMYPSTTATIVASIADKVAITRLCQANQ